MTMSCYCYAMKMKKITLYISTRQYIAIKNAAHEIGIPYGELFRRIIDAWIDHNAKVEKL